MAFRDCAEAFKSGLTTSGVYTLTFPNSTEEIKVGCSLPGVTPQLRAVTQPGPAQPHSHRTSWAPGPSSCRHCPGAHHAGALAHPSSYPRLALGLAVGAVSCPP